MIIFAFMNQEELDRRDIGSAFVRLGRILEGYLCDKPDVSDMYKKVLDEAVSQSIATNGWFTLESIRQSLGAISYMLREEAMRQWLEGFEGREMASRLRVGVVSAGNIPAVGFHDFLCVLISGNRYVGKLSRDDQFLMPAFAVILNELLPGLEEYIQFSNERLKEFDAVIATGSGNTSRYFEYYFGQYPSIIRKNRSSAIVITGGEERSDLEAFCCDIFDYYGLGCRNASMVLYPENYDLKNLMDVLSERGEVMNMSKYANNVEYRRAIMIMGQEPFYDTGNLLLRASEQLDSPVGVVHIKAYKTEEELFDWLERNRDAIQCVVGIAEDPRFIKPGRGQYPELWDYADGVDVMDFLFCIKK